MLAACSQPGDDNASTATSTGAAQKVDLAALSQLEDDMPPGFVPYPSEVRELKPIYVAGVGSVVSSGKPFTVEPSECRTLLQPVEGRAGADTMGIRADGPERRAISVGADTPVSVPAEIPERGCDRLTYTVPDDNNPRRGSAERIDAPDIDGAATFALKITTDGYADPEYFYAAIFDDVYVHVDARLAPDFAAQPLLPDLLVKAVSSVRG
ncbi:hypothetical protein DQP55_22485 [Mycolicibacterium sp. GF69]|nr:hypothetical protein DQP55_22485 [Mycolicibacterium sp. GF69]